MLKDHMIKWEKATGTLTFDFNPMASLTVGIGFVIGIVLCELLFRTFFNFKSLNEMLHLGYSRNGVAISSATCYPTQHAQIFPVVLTTPEGRKEFITRLPEVKILTSAFDELDPLFVKMGFQEGQFRTSEVLDEIASRTPYCVLYSREEDSLRHLVAPTGYHASIAMLGDSFTFGQGVRDEETIPYQLAYLSNIRVVSYAYQGADLPEILLQFKTALSERKRYSISKILYLFFLNDPLMSPELRGQMSKIDNLVGRHWTLWREHPDVSMRLARKVASYSTLFRFFLEKVAGRQVHDRTIQWYKDVFDRQINTRLIETFDKIAQMKKLANAAGVAFEMVVYPIMLDFKNYPFDQIHQTASSLALERNIPFLDLLPYFKTLEVSTDSLVVHPVDHHPNATADRVAAKAIADSIAK